MKKSSLKSVLKDYEATIEYLNNDSEDLLKENSDLHNEVDTLHSKIETLEVECDNLRVENNNLKKKNKKLKETSSDLNQSLLVSQHVVCCQEETISILKNQNKQDNNRYNGLLKIISNLT